MSNYKENINESKERLKAWWDHEIIDRPCIAYYHFLPGLKNLTIEDISEYFGQPWYLAQNWDKIDFYFDKFKEVIKNLMFGAEAIPRIFPNYGPGIMASVFGIVPKFQSNTVWFHKETSVEEIVPLLEGVKLNQENPWYTRLLRITEYLAKHAENDIP